MIPLRHRIDALNFFLADVRGGLGAFVSVFLLTEGKWTPAEIGAVLSVSGLIGITVHAPVGALIDATKAKRSLIVISVGLLAACAIAIERSPTGPVVFSADVIMAVLGGVFAPTVAAITLGATPAIEFANRLARNAVFDRTGNLFITALVGMVGWWASQRTTFYLVPVFALLSAWAALSIPASAIDHERARGLPQGERRDDPEPWWRIVVNHPALLVLAGTLATFHFASASLLPLLGQKLALANPGLETPLLSAAMLISQIVTMPVALLVGVKSEVWGRKTFLAAACVALAVRSSIFAACDSAPVLLAAQLLDGVSAGILDVLIPLMLADIVAGSGRYSMSRGLLSTIQGVGGSLSNIAAGTLVVWGGYTTAFWTMAGFALLAMCLVVFGLRETRVVVRSSRFRSNG